MITLESVNVFLREKQVTVHSERLECHLNNFKEILQSNEIFDIEARFYDLLSGDYLENQEIFFEMFASDLVLYEYNFTTNSKGEIDLSIDVPSQMSLGNNTLRFSVINSPQYNNTVFEYCVFVGQSVAGGPEDNPIFVIVASSLGIVGVVGLIVIIGVKKLR